MKMSEEDMQKMTTTPELLIENQLCFTIYACSREITKLYQPYLDKIGLTYSQYLVMLVLWERQQCTVKEIGEALFLDSGTLTPLLKRLQAAGLIIRERSMQDERKVLISLTKQGWALQSDAVCIPGKMMEETTLTNNESIELLDQFKDLLNRVHEANIQDSKK
ncbi:MULTISPECIES: MarR family transcriptional regulator [Paenibacillus]|jgi:DNA-binding MarR family transcriptional regulator|nr:MULTISPECIES: MarR family transcriptional regulator [Paenibacillus]MDH6444248.1 DNA-binding MarR family transcriptional regulator [Paenibacillus sp. PastF-4]ETT45965.1 HTH-type transcriptional regulator sarZ [Paenibacillus sp. FSL H8-237]MDH6428120.1 DNA-binding MarR family transcriptional regulator [Paenibacillus sp. PastH-4]MDH6528151.1 DNA-binding MarR family transcriptional regulator [Paenibacillus sp. PastH-3]MEC0133171.1 MarR family transcriptional regulator [Paenibacillus odorifer]